MICSGKKLRLWLVILTLLTFSPSWAPTDFVRPTTHRRGAVRLAAAGETWWCYRGGINRKLKDCFEANMQVDGVLLLKNYDTCWRIMTHTRLRRPLKLCKLQFYVRKSDLDVFAARLAAVEQGPTVANITAASHSGKSASVLVGSLRSSELNSRDVAPLNFTHYYWYVPFANDGVEIKLKRACGEALGAAYMRECSKAQAFSAAYAEYWQTPEQWTQRTRRSCLRRRSPPSCRVVQTAWFWCT